MSGLLYLTAEDFNIREGMKGCMLCTNIRGYSVLLIYSTACEYCKDLLPVFKHLPGTVGNCQFAMINVSVNRNVVLMSKDTMVPITYVPYILFYVDGKPFMKYSGANDINEIKRFIFEVTRKLGAKKFYEETTAKHETENKIPEYTIGTPKSGNTKSVGDMICEDGVCYLDFNGEGYIKN